MLRQAYRFLRAHLLQRIIRASREEIFAHGRQAIEVVGFFRSASGIGESARLCALQLHNSGRKVRCVSVEKFFLKPVEIDWQFENTATEEEVGCRILHLNPPMMPPLVLRMGLRRYAEVYNIGYWAWELGKIPVEWTHACRYVNAIFCPSDFTSQAVRNNTDKPVVTVPHPVSLSEICPSMRKRLGLPERAFVVSSLFSFGSALERKNAYAAVDAFVEAFAELDHAFLVLKTNHGSDTAEKNQFLTYIKRYPTIRLIDDIWRKDEVLGLVASSDAYLSLHRSEGFGLTIAEAMIVGTPTVVTDWSGNRDFCNSKNSFLIPCSLVPVQSKHPEFSGLKDVVWAEPDVAAAATALKTIYTHPEQARAKAAVCLEETNRYFSEPRYAEALQSLTRHEDGQITVAGFTVLGTTAVDLASRLLAYHKANKQIALFFANTNFVVKCAAIRHLMDDAVIVVNDGIGMDIAARLIGNSRFKDNLNGTDFLPFLFRQVARPLRVFLLGGRPEIVARASRFVEEKLGQLSVGYCDGYEGMRNAARLIDIINSAQPDIVLVALGNPIQEQWILDNRSRLNVPILAGVGALFDFWAGAKPRAPLLIQKARMEWFYRLCLEPRRLTRRYTIDIARFLLHCYRYR